MVIAKYKKPLHNEQPRREAVPTYEVVSRATQPIGGERVFDPAIHIMDNGTIVVAYSAYPSGSNGGGAYSTDNGATWTNTPNTIAYGHYFFFLFSIGATLYLMSRDINSGNLYIRKSINNGVSWTNLTLLNSAYWWHYAPNRVIKLGTKRYLSPQVYVNPNAENDPWISRAYATVVASIDESLDPLIPANWTFSNVLTWNHTLLPSPYNATSPYSIHAHYMESELVLHPTDSNLLYVISRFNNNSSLDKAFYKTYNIATNTISFNYSNIIDLPGGSSFKFSVQRCPYTNKYLLMAGDTESYAGDYITAFGGNPFGNFRSRLSLFVADNPISGNWTRLKTLLWDDLFPDDLLASLNTTGFQYPAFEIKGVDIHAMIRVAYNGAPNEHDSNRMWYLKIPNYLRYL